MFSPDVTPGPTSPAACACRYQGQHAGHTALCAGSAQACGGGDGDMPLLLHPRPERPDDARDLLTMTRLGRAIVLAGQIRDETSRADPDWRQIAADSAELQRIAETLGRDQR